MTAISRKFEAILKLLRMINQPTRKSLLQRGIYILQEGLGVNLGYRFRFYTQGPYSNDLACDIDILEDMGLIGANYLPDKQKYFYRITDKGLLFLEQISENSSVTEEKVQKVASLPNLELSGNLPLFCQTSSSSAKRLVTGHKAVLRS
jgi:uncharacterized protein YwgA